MHRNVTLLFILAMLFTGAQVQAAEIFSVKPGYLLLSPSGIFAADGGNLIRTEIDIERDLNYEDSQGFYGEAAFNLGSLRLALSYIPIEFEGQDGISATINFNGVSFPAGIKVSSNTTLDIIEGALAWQVIDLDNGPVRLQLGPELTLKYINAEMSLGNILIGQLETVSEQVPLPTFGGRARVALGDFLGIVGRLGYISYLDNEMLDYELQVEFSPIPLFGLFGGYRYMDLKVDESGIFIDASMQGPFAGILARF